MASERRDPHANKVDRASADSFPASDPPSYSGVTGPGGPVPGPKRDDEERPTGMPTSDRHATETAHQGEDEIRPGEKQGGKN